MYDTRSMILENARARMEWLRTTTRLSYRQMCQRAGHPTRWLHELTEARYPRRIGSDVLDRAAEILGTPPWRLVAPDYQASEGGVPAHLKKTTGE